VGPAGAGNLVGDICRFTGEMAAENFCNIFLDAGGAAGVGYIAGGGVHRHYSGAVGAPFFGETALLFVLTFVIIFIRASFFETHNCGPPHFILGKRGAANAKKRNFFKKKKKKK